MASFIDFAFREEYERVRILGDKLSEIDSIISWEAFRPIVKDIYDNKTEKGGHPNIDEIIMIKILVLQEWHGLIEKSGKNCSDSLMQKDQGKERSDPGCYFHNLIPRTCKSG